MVAVMGERCRLSRQGPLRRARALRRLVAVAMSPAELRQGSDLARQLADAVQVDLLFVTDGEHGDDRPTDDPEDDLPDPGVALRAAVVDLGLPQLGVHRLALPAAPRPQDVDRHVDDVVAALSELVGFDPEPGVGCLVPVGAAPAGPADLVVGRAVERIVAVYRLPLRTYGQ